MAQAHPTPPGTSSLHTENLRGSEFSIPPPTSQTRKGAGQRKSSGALIPLPDPLTDPLPLMSLRAGTSREEPSLPAGAVLCTSLL